MAGGVILVCGWIMVVGWIADFFCSIGLARWSVMDNRAFLCPFSRYAGGYFCDINYNRYGYKYHRFQSRHPNR